MRLHYLQHASFEGPALAGEWALEQGFHITSTHLYKGEILPSVQEFDWLLIMGGPMSVNEETIYTWLIPEKKLVREAIDAGKTVIGICLGAQIIANSLGSSVFPNAEKEIGWFPIKMQEGAVGQPLFKEFPSELPVMHWHGETFDLPTGAVRIASSAACLNQIFVHGNSVLAMQCHPEFTQASVESMLLHCSDELVPGTYIQNEASLKEGLHQVEAAKKALFGVLNALLANSKF